MNKKHLIVGGNSFIGKGIIRALEFLGETLGNTIFYTSRQIEQKSDVCYYFNAQYPLRFDDICHFRKFDAIYYCAAKNGYAVCEQDPTAFIVNVDCPIEIANVMEGDSRLVYLSSDAVGFALNTSYGLQKALAEMSLRANPHAVVARLSKVSEKHILQVCNRIIECGIGPEVQFGARRLIRIVPDVYP
jgi:dTDP-4-dehydrorhamnose reductase